MRRLSPAEDHFLLLACDGLWDVLTDAEACRVVPLSCYLLTSSLQYYLTYHLTILLSDLLTYFMHSDSKACRIVVEGLHRLGSPQEVQPRPRMPHVAPCTPRLARTLHAPARTCTHLHAPCTHPARTLQSGVRPAGRDGTALGKVHRQRVGCARHARLVARWRVNGGEEGRLVGGWGVEVGAVCLWLL